MLEQNRAAFDYLGITRYHREGHTGAGMKVAVIDLNYPLGETHLAGIVTPVGGYGGGTNPHGIYSADILRQVAPGADIYLMDSRDSNLRWCIENGMHLASMSLSWHGRRDIFLDLSYRAATGGMFLCSSAGNVSTRGVTMPASSWSWVAVGAAYLTGHGVPVRADYSSVGGELEVMALSHLKVQGINGVMTYSGTSCACPVFTGMLALWLATMPRRVPKDAFRDAVYKYSERMGGHDRADCTGYGLFRLPPPGSVM